MAFDLNRYVQSGFNVNNDPDAIREAAEAINNREYWGLVGQTSPLGWASTAISRLDEYEQQLARVEAGERDPDMIVGRNQNGTYTVQDNLDRLLSEAHAWITGSMQPTRARSVRRRYNDTRRDVQQDVANELSNIANVEDIPDDASPAERARIMEAAQRRRDQIQSRLGEAQLLGIDVPEPVRDERGNFIPGGEATTQNDRSSNALLINERTETDAEGNEVSVFDIVRADGTVVESSIDNVQEALAIQQQISGGSTPHLTGQPNVFAVEPTSESELQAIAEGRARVATPEELANVGIAPATGNGQVGTGIDPQTGLPGNIDTSAFTPEQIAFLQEAGAIAGNNEDLATQMLQNAEITDADIQGFLEQARTETDPYFDQIFERGLEDFSFGLQAERDARLRELEAEDISAANAITNQQASLEARGLTSSGEAVETLGAESALSEERLGEELPEGLIPTQNRLISSSSEARFNERVRNFGRSAEETFGSEAVAGTDIPSLNSSRIFTPTPGVRGSLERQQTTAVQNRANELERTARIRNLAAAGEGATSQIIGLL